ncbi:hypothetical protein HU200_047469 [Digitaria exilis]|uniref:Cytochrome P450 n=1 Tax=Digitaria exilis TaxID=1010633 RepID=A0A835EBS4_9POAL|nr:hypothetical protein HU200_047469 [Digitaria exilis]
MDGGAPELLREASPWSVLAGAAAVLLLWWAAQVLDWAWLAPRRMERALRAQGLKGTRYRFLWGDLKEERRLAVEALSRPVPMGRPHDILPRVSPLLHRAVEERGKLSFTWFGTTPRVTIIDPELVREVTSNKDGNFVKTKLATRIVKLLIGGVAILDGEKWAKHRRIMNPAFHAEKLKISHRPLPLLVSLLPTKNNRRMKAINRETNTILRGIIEKRYKTMENGEPAKDDLLGMLLQSNMNYSNSDGKSSKGITVEEVIEECKLFYFAGTETTAVLLTWTMVALSMHPEWLDRARDEVMQVFGQNKPDLSGISRLKVVTMVLYEVLRLYPPALFLNRRTHKQTELGGVMYPPDVMFVIPIMFIHRDPVFWGPDAGEFNPGRFAEGVSKACSDPGAFIPFSWGPRVCIGQNFALLEAKLGISMILQRFAFELSPAYVHAPYNILTLHPQHSVLVRVRRL